MPKKAGIGSHVPPGLQRFDSEARSAIQPGESEAEQMRSMRYSAVAPLMRLNASMPAYPITNSGAGTGTNP